jgi:Periplasmic copper-binding protein (NosD).
MKNMKKTSMKAILIAFVVLFALTGTAFAKEWTVGSSGADFQTVQEAVTAAADKDVIRVSSGTYTFSANLSIGKSIEIVGENKETVIFDLGGFSFIPKKENFILRNVTLKNGSNGINLQTDATDALIENCIFDGMTHKDGIKLAKDGAVFKNNIVKNMSGFTNVIYVTGNNVEIIGNTLTGLSGSGNAARMICVENAGGVLIKGNTITNNGAEAIRLWKVDTADAVITENAITGNAQKGVYLYNAGENNAIYLNDISGNSGGNIASYGTLPNTVIFNNPETLTSVYNGVSWTGKHGNYWGEEYKGADTAGNGIGSTAKSILNKYEDLHPLTDSISKYSLSFEGGAGGETPDDPEIPDGPEIPDDPEIPEENGKTAGTTVSMTTNILQSVSVSFSVDSLDFGDLAAGQTSAPKEMRITNSGGCDVIVTAEVTDSSDDLYKRGLWIDDEFWPDFERTVQKDRTVTSEIVLKVPTDYTGTGNIDGTLILWVEAC